MGGDSLELYMIDTSIAKAHCGINYVAAPGSSGIPAPTGSGGG